MSLPVEINPHLLASSGGYRIERSLRFNSADSAYLSRTTWGTPTNRKKGTFSFWVKRSEIGSSSRYLVYSYNGSANNSFGIYFVSDNTLEFQFGGSSAKNIRTNAVFRDPSAWYHVVCAWDTTDATAANRTKIYVNNVEQALGTTNYPSQNDDAQFPATTDNYIGYESSITLGGYLTESYFIDGSALTPSSFGETDTDTGVWKPKAYSGSYGTNGFYLKFADNSGTTSTTLGKDSSGNGNNWTPNNFSVTAGVGNDSLVDTPTPYGTDTGAGGEVRGNYCTLNPLQSGLTLANGNLDVSGNDRTSLGTIYVSSGKWYFEATLISSTSDGDAIGIAQSNIALVLNGSYSTGTFNLYQKNGDKRTSAGFVSYGASYTTNDVIGVAFDADAGTLTFYKNNSSQGTAFTGLSGLYAPHVFSPGTSSWVMNFGQRPFAYTAPSGFKALCTQNLPTPTIGATATTRADDYFNTVLYTGNSNSTGATRNISGVGFQPDFVWIKTRTDPYSHQLYDAVRGAGSSKNLQSDQTSAEGNLASLYGYVSAFQTDGFQTTNGTDGANSGIWVNALNENFVAWNWKANGAGSTNNAGSIQSTVSVNTTAGFSVVTYTGNNTLAQSVGHGLGAAPSMIIVKSRSNATNWLVWHSAISIDSTLLLNDVSAVITGLTGIWGSALPTSTTFGLNRLDTDNNRSGQTYVAYCFAPVAGYSAFGSYVANGSTDGNFIYTGMAPRFVLVKCSSTAENWAIFDTARDTYNVAGKLLRPNLPDAELDSPPRIDILSNGFKVRAAGTSLPNTSGATYIYAAFAEFPFKYSLAR